MYKSMCVFLVAILLTSCGAPQKTAENDKIFNWISSGVDSTINPHESSAVANFEIVDLITAALYTWVPAQDGAALVPCLAVSEPESADGRTWIIRVNPDAKWANGEPITAGDFIYSWRMGLAPGLGYTYTAAIANQVIDIKNAFAYYTQSDESLVWEDVGLKALDDYTLEITASQRYTPAEVMRHFAHRATAPVYEPLYEAGMNAARSATAYGSSLEYFMSSGAYTLVHWVKGSERRFEKNALYPLADMIQLDGIYCRVAADELARLSLFEDGASDYVDLGPAGYARYGEDPRVLTYDMKTVRALEFNRDHPDLPILADPDFRKAVYCATDRAAVAALLNAAPAPYFISTQAIAFDDGTTYRSVPEAGAWLPDNYGYDPELAVEHMRTALERWGLDSIAFTLTYSEDIPSLRAASELVQAGWEKVFGGVCSISLRAVPHTAALAMMKESVSGPADSWELCWSGWTLAAETFQPYAKFAPYRGFALNRYTNYANALLDERYALLTTEEYRLDRRKSFELTLELEKSLILDDMTCVPVFQERGHALFSERVDLPGGYTPMLGFAWPFAGLR